MGGYCELAPEWPVYIPSFESCRNFVQCSEYGGQYICSCPEGLQYNHRDGVCEWPNARECCERSEDEGHKDHIFGGHVGDYMEKLEEENEEAFKRQFSRFIKNGINSENIEEMYKKAH